MPPATPPHRTDAQRQVRLNHLTERLRNRQITMEEATELFSIMQGMLRASEAARIARSASPPPAEGPRRPARGPEPARGAGVAPDDLLLGGILAMGAGAGILAAIAKRMAEGAPPPGRRPGAPKASP